MRVRRLLNHDMTFGNGAVNIAQGSESVMQRVETRLYLLREEWALDMGAGVPYLQQITVRASDRPMAAAIIKQTILRTPDVTGISKFEFLFDSGSRRFNIIAAVQTVFGLPQTLVLNL